MLKTMSVSKNRNLKENPKTDRYFQKPEHYIYCLKEGCPKANSCLHKLWFENVRKGHQKFEVYNTELQEVTSEGCRHYICDGRTRWLAWGFTGQVSRMPTVVKKRFQSECMRWVCKTIYYDMRSGKRMLTPTEQSSIRQCAQKVGWHFPANGFDQMIEVPDYGEV